MAGRAIGQIAQHRFPVVQQQDTAFLDPAWRNCQLIERRSEYAYYNRRKQRIAVSYRNKKKQYEQKIDRQALLTAVESCTGLTESQRADLHQLLTETPKYGLVWEDTPEEVYDELKEEIPVMNEDRSKAIVNGNEYPNHVIIEGDNLHALTDLCYTHAGKIDVIYIDPPYNTGNKDFVYNDSFVDRDNGFRHSMWLSFMDKRLRLLSELISDDGTLFISIDENEHAPLKMLCDEILGEENFVCDLIWQSTPGSNTGTDIKTVTESVLMYSKGEVKNI